MTRMKQQVCAGVRVDAHPAKVMSVSTEYYYANDPPSITMRRIGGETIHLTPAEARQIADMLRGAAELLEPSS